MLELETAWLVVGLVEGYLGLGIVVGLLVVFVASAGARIDRGLAASGLGFRLLILPGCVLLWPWLALRTLRGDGARPTERNAHRARTPS